jgi:hypothetical protein
MSQQKTDHFIRNGFIVLGCVLFFSYAFFSYVHWQLASAIDCSLVTTPAIDEPQNGNIGMTFLGQTITVQQSRDLCFDLFMIHKVEICYYINCGPDVNQTINYESQTIKQSLSEPTKLHLYPKEGEKFTVLDVTEYKVLIIIILGGPIVVLGFTFYMFRDPKEDKSVNRPHGTLPKGFGKDEGLST